MKKSKNIIWIIAVIALSILVYAFIETDDNETVTATQETQKARRQDISSSVTATGIIKPQVGAEVRIGTRASGTVTNLYVNIGDYVKEGQLLAKIDASELNARYQQALANLKYAETTLKYAKIELGRMQKLNSKEYVSQQALEEAEQTVEISESRLMQEKSNVDFARIQLSYTKIFASTSGVIGSVSTQKGETVSAAFSSPTFVTIIDLERLEVWAYIDETDIGKVTNKQKVVFTVDTYPETEFSGVVTAIYPQAEIRNNVVNYIAIIKIENQEGKILRPEMTASVNIYMTKHENVLCIPNKALTRKNGKYFVTVLKDNQLIENEVKTGLRENSWVEILEGINETDKIIINN